MSTTDPAAVADPAERVVLVAWPAEGRPVTDGWVESALAEPAYHRYLRHAHAGPVAVGEEWTEFVSCGCASPLDVRLRVERVGGGTAVGADTELVVRTRAAEPDDRAPGSPR